MRSFLAAVLWLVTTALLAAAVPAAWAQRNIVDRQGYSSLALRAADDRDLQSATAGELATQIGRLGYDADPTAVARAARAYTASARFPGQFAEANGFAHQWVFAGTGSTVDAQGRWVIDVAPMLDDESFAQTLRDYRITVPESVPIPLADNAPRLLRPGGLREVGQWWPRLSAGLAGLGLVAALLTLALARRRGRALLALGLSGVIVGASGWAAMGLGRRALLTALESTSGNTRRIAEVMAATAEHSAYQWLNTTVATGAAVGVCAALVMRLSPRRRASGAGTNNSTRP